MEAFKVEQENFERFRNLVLADRNLHDELRATANEEAFTTLAVRLGAERGCVFTPQFVASAIGDQRRAWFERWI